MTITTRLKNIEAQLSIGNEPLDAESCKLFGLEYGSATQSDAKAAYDRACSDVRSHPKFMIKKRALSNNSTLC